MSSQISKLILGIMGFGVLSVEVAVLAFVRRSDAIYYAAGVMGVIFVVSAGYAWALTLRRARDRVERDGLWPLTWIVYWVVFVVVFLSLLPGILFS